MPDRYGLGRNNRQGYARYTAWFRSGYHLESTTTGERLVVRTATLDRENAELPSVSDIWKAADFLEREVYDFYGIVFIGHPDMRRLYLRNDWVGYPMRKDNDPEKDNPLRMDNEETIDTTTELALNRMVQ